MDALEVYCVVLAVESRESERDMATDVIAGVMLEVGDVKNILSSVGGCEVGGRL